MRLTQFLRRGVSAAVVECPYNENDEVDTVFLERCVSASVVELHRVGSATNRATRSSCLLMFMQSHYMFSGNELLHM